MFKSTKVHMIAMLAVGGLLGYAAAWGKLDVFREALAASPQQPVAENAANPAKCGADSCCLEGLTKGQLVASVDHRVNAAGSHAQDSGKKPNILMLMQDDTGWFDFGCYHGGKALGHPTPNVDRMAKEGAMFTCWYGQASCTAGRASFITGRIPIRSALSIVVAPGDENALKKETPTIAEFFKKNGYSTYFSGKWHLGDKPEAYPIEHGFDEMKAFAAYYPGVYTYADTTKWFHPWFPSFTTLSYISLNCRLNLGE